MIATNMMIETFVLCRQFFHSRRKQITFLESRHHRGVNAIPNRAIEQALLMSQIRDEVDLLKYFIKETNLRKRLASHSRTTTKSILKLPLLQQKLIIVY